MAFSSGSLECIPITSRSSRRPACGDPRRRFSDRSSVNWSATAGLPARVGRPALSAGPRPGWAEAYPLAPELIASVPASVRLTRSIAGALQGNCLRSSWISWLTGSVSSIPAAPAGHAVNWLLPGWLVGEPLAAERGASEQPGAFCMSRVAGFGLR